MSKVASKATSKETSTDKAEAIALVSVPAEIKALITESADTSRVADIAATNKEQTIIKLGDKLASLMGKHDKAVTKASVAPLFNAAYKAVNDKLIASKHPKAKADDGLKLYIGQQLSRVLSIAYPGGQGATPKQAEKAKAEYNAAKAAGLGTLGLLSITSGNAKLGTDPKTKKPIAVPVKKATRGGGNKETPIAVFTKAIDTAITAANVAKIDREQMLTIITSALVACELMDKDEELTVEWRTKKPKYDETSFARLADAIMHPEKKKKKKKK